MDFINQLRQKPSGTRKKIAFTASAIVTLMIFGVWASVLHFGIDKKTDNVTASVANSSSADVNPASALLDVISKGWDGLVDNINQFKTGVNDVKNLVNTIDETTPATSVPTSADVFILDNITQ